MVGAGLFGSAAGIVSFVAAIFLTLRAGPVERATVSLQLRSGPVERVSAVFEYLNSDLDTCPASCPSPSLAFCAGPLLDRLETAASVVFPFLPVFAFGLACFVFGVFVGKCSSPCPAPLPPRRPHGSRLGQIDAPSSSRN